MEPLTTLPSWILLIPALLLSTLSAAWLVLRGRPSWATHQLKVLAMLGGLGWLIGAASRALRPYADINGLHLEAVGTLALLLGVTLWRLIKHGLAHKQQRAISRYSAEILLMWAGLIAGWTRVNAAIWGDALMVWSAWGVGSLCVGALILRLWHRRSA